MLRIYGDYLSSFPVFSRSHLDPYGSTVQYLEAAFRNIYNKGVLVLTSTDVAALYGKCTQVTLRNYGAYTTKVDYMKEVAARVVIAAAVRSVRGSTVPCQLVLTNLRSDFS